MISPERSPPLLALAATFLTLAGSLLAEDLRFDYFEHISVEDGLSHSTVWDLHQDRRGFLWFATVRALNRYDGYEFKVYRHDRDDPESLSSSEVIVIHEDREGNLWFGTRSGGLNRFDPSEERFERFEHDAADPTSLLGDRVRSLLEDRSGTLWVGTEAGLNRRRPDGRFTHYRHDPADAHSLSDGLVWTLLEDREGRLWVGTLGGGLNRFEPHSGTFVHFRHDPMDPYSLLDNRIFALFEDRAGRLWVGTAVGLCRFKAGRTAGGEDGGNFVCYKPEPDDPETLSGPRVLSILEDRSGELWIGTSDGLNRLVDVEAGRFRHVRYEPDSPHSLSSSYITDLHEDRSGILWIATRAGVNKFDCRRERFTTLRPRQGSRGILGGQQVSAVAQDAAGVIWVGAREGGLTALDQEGGTAVTYRAEPVRPDGLSHNTIASVLEDRHGELWIGTRGGGLNRFDRERQRFTHYRHSPGDASSLAGDLVRGLLEDSAGSLWIGIYAVGVQRFDREHHTFTTYRHDASDPHSLSSGFVYDLYEDRSGDLWVATFGGLNRLRKGRGARPGAYTVTFRRYLHDPQNPNSLSHDDVNDVLEDDSGVLWIGTSGGGLNRLDPTRSEFRSYWQKDGLPDDNVLALVEGDGGELWLSTGNGLSRFDPRLETFRNYDVSDGLHGNVFYAGPAFKSSRGEIFFGGDGGLTSFFPDRIVDDTRPPRVVLTDFRLLNEPVPLRHRDSASPLTRSITDTDELVLTHHHKVVGFEFAALHFSAPHKNRYAYRLEGFDSDWIETGGRKRFAQYTNLAPGPYTFRVKASNSDGVWSEEEASVGITVLPPPWKTWWAYGLYALAVMAVAWGFVHSQRKKLRREQEISQRLRAVDKLKDEFLANTSHELRTPLYGITGLTESLIDGATGELGEETRAHLEMVVASGRRLMTLVNDILDFSQLKHRSLELELRPVDLHALVDVVLTLLRPLVGVKDLQLGNHIAPDLPPARADENRLQQVLFNLVGNAIKFTEQGEVEVAAVEQEGRLLVRVRDTGIGIPREQQEQIFEAFVQADGSAERELGGTGLGLAVTRQLLELHGSTLGLESTPGEGSTFFFDLPVAAEDVSSKRMPKATAPAVKAAPASLAIAPPAGQTPEAGSLNAVASILVVDDEPVNRQVLFNHLASAGYRVEQAAGGAEALRRIEERRPDLVLLDVMMPRLSGYEVCRNLRERFPLDELPVLFLTAKSRPTDLVVGLAAGANDYLPKPISKPELLARVKTHLALSTVNRHLSELVAQRTAEVEERERLLRERERLVGDLEARNSELARINYTVSHDLKNPLTTIKNFIGLARLDAEQGKTKRLENDLDQLQTAADELNLLLDELFELSSVEVHANPPEDVAFAELVKTALGALETAITERAAEVEVVPGLPAVRGDRPRLEKLVRHLVHNALVYADPSRVPKIEIGARLEEGAPIFYVSDNGIGIAPKYHDKVFGLFERLDPEAGKGTGVGLALARRIVEVHGGRIWVESEGMAAKQTQGCGPGSTFYFTLRAGDAEMYAKDGAGHSA